LFFTRGLALLLLAPLKYANLTRPAASGKRKESDSKEDFRFPFVAELIIPILEAERGARALSAKAGSYFSGREPVSETGPYGVPASQTEVTAKL